ncbi:hypothetical protein NPIL_361541 [Nephila pilipes]|uniref:Uncharacterized protein n=1 Tax=Nephila pilipes TaxID=299642 RepID=A0A8X6PYH7_NEPPI|nr:hypothetical protein NPIL_361541 [Nephila pilipes]
MPLTAFKYEPTFSSLSTLTAEEDRRTYLASSPRTSPDHPERDLKGEQPHSEQMFYGLFSTDDATGAHLSSVPREVGK